MDEFLNLTEDDRREALGVAATKTGRPAYLLEKDVYVVWALDTLFQDQIGEHLVFKGGTSLSKAYNGVIRRFSEDIDLTYDIHQLIPETGEGDGEPQPTSGSQSKRWTDAVNEKLPTWLAGTVVPLLQAAIDSKDLKLKMTHDEEHHKITLAYPPLYEGSGYVKPEVVLEFGARSTGKPAEIREVTCDAAPALDGVTFPQAKPRVMAAERTFWEKATAAHVYCLKGKMYPRYARHWYDLVMLDRAGIGDRAIADRDLANQVAEHKRWFFKEKDADGNVIDYHQAVAGNLRLVPDELQVLREDFGKMIAEGMFEDTPPSFDELMQGCREIEKKANRAGQV